MQYNITIDNRCSDEIGSYINTTSVYAGTTQHIDCEIIFDK